MLKTQKLLGTIILLVVIFISSCKESALLDQSLIPQVDNVNTFQSDTFTVVANNIFNDSISKEQIATSGLAFPALGTIANDPVMGKTVASVLFQVRQPVALFTLPDTITVDSIVLSMPIAPNYGDTNASTCINQTFNAYRLTDTSFHNTTVYYNTSNLAYDASTLLGSGTVNFAKFKTTDSLILPEGTSSPQLRIKLSAAFADSLLALKSDSTYNTFASFVTWLRGIYVTPADTTIGNSLGYVNIVAAKIRLYTRSTTNGILDTIPYDFVVDNTVCAHFNKISKNYTLNNPQIKSYINTGNVAGDSLLFIQSNVGNVIEVRMPYLAQFPNAIINKANFEFTVLPSMYPNTDSLYWPPARIKALGIDEYGTQYTLTADYGDDAYYPMAGGYLKDTTLNGVKVRKYKVNLAHFVQKMIVSKSNKLRLEFIGVNSQIAAGRVVLGGTNRATDKMKLNIIYTKIK